MIETIHITFLASMSVQNVNRMLFILLLVYFIKFQHIVFDIKTIWHLFGSLCCVLIYFILNWGGVSRLPASKYYTKSLKMIWFKWRWVWMPKNSTSLLFCRVSVLQLEALEHYPFGVPLEQMKGCVCWKLHALHVNICTSKNVFPKLAQNWKQNKNAWKHC